MTSEIRTNTIKNRVGLGTVSFTNTGPVVSGIVTANSFSGPLTTTSIDLNGDLDVDGHTNLDNVSIAGVTTTSGNIIIENAEPSLFLSDTNGNPDYKIFNDQGAFKIYDTTYSATRLQIGPSNGEMTVLSNTNFPNGITMNPGTASVVNTIAQRLGDTDTKIRFPAADTFSVETAGTERFRITSSGEVKIMNTSGTVGLYFQSSSGAVSNFRAIGTNNQSLGYFFGNSERVRFSSDGKVGINSTSPSHNLDIVSSSNPYLKLLRSGYNPVYIGNAAGEGVIETTGATFIKTGGSERLRITSDGLIQAKTRSAGVRRMILSGSPSNSAFNIEAHDGATGTSANTNQGELGLYYNDGSTLTDEAVIKFYRGSGAGDGYFGFNTGSTEKLRIENNGGLKFTGQGTSIPVGGILHHTNNNLYVRGGTGGLVLGNQDNTNTIAISESNFIRFETNNGTERLRIDSSGRMLVSGTLGYGNMPFGGNPANAAIQIRCNTKYNGIAFGENAVSGCIGMGGAESSTAMVFVANAHPANLGGGTHDTFEWWSGNSGGGGPGKYMTLNTGGHLALTTGNLEFANGSGIDFSAVPDGGRSLQSDGNKLDDYEEGLWTPTLYYGSGTSEPSYSWRYGNYVKIGRQVTAWFNIGISGFSASYSQAWIGGLPFQADDPSGTWKYLNHMMGYSFASGWGDGGSDKHMFLAIYDNATKMMINYEGNHLSTGDIGSGQRFSCTVTYQTDG